jgi:hypothetical protein
MALCGKFGLIHGTTVPFMVLSLWSAHVHKGVVQKEYERTGSLQP